jgi:hypothetical protein
MSNVSSTQLLRRSVVRRAAAAIAVLTAAAFAMPHASAGPPVLDGKTVKNLHTVFEAATGASGTDPTPEQVASCAPPACARLTFVYKPAKGVKAPLSVSERNFWAVIGDDDLYLMQGTKVIGSCTGTVSSARYLSVPASALKSGTTYTAVLYVSHEIGESTSMNVDLPAKAQRESVTFDPNEPFDYSTTMCGT